MTAPRTLTGAVPVWAMESIGRSSGALDGAAAEAKTETKNHSERQYNEGAERGTRFCRSLSARLCNRLYRMRPVSFLMFPRRVILTAILCAASIVIVGLALRGCQSRPVAPPTCTSLQPWVFYGGDWTSDGNMLESIRNGRGDMAISRRQGYRDFDFTMQMQMHDLYPGTNYGDAGVLFHVANPHIGGRLLHRLLHGPSRKRPRAFFRARGWRVETAGLYTAAGSRGGRELVQAFCAGARLPFFG